jgi:hypothetical protein
VKVIVGIEPSGPPVHSIELLGVPDWFKDGPVALPYGITACH